jgi:hypothetical protein
MGCIVMSDDEYAEFEQTIKRECAGLDKIKLWVQYDF